MLSSGRAGYLVRRYEYQAAVDRTAFVARELALILRERGKEPLGY